MDNDITLEELWQRFVNINERLHKAESKLYHLQRMFFAHKHDSNIGIVVRDRIEEERIICDDLSLSHVREEAK
jgi:hypothetical protein